jgi:hypothetical protein
MTAHTLDFRLIKAAPDLLDLAKNIAGLDESCLRNHVILINAVQEWREQARAAVAKASS